MEKIEITGMVVKIVRYDGREVYYRNVTQIHYGYGSALGSDHIAFESDIHATGITDNMANIRELEVLPEINIQVEF